MKKFLKISIPIVLILIAFGIFFFDYKSKVSEIRETALVEFNDQVLVVDVADERGEREKGLGGREDLWINGGMLFLFGFEGDHNFWMKGMSFPIDIVWIEGNRVVGISSNVPPPEPGTSREELKIYSPPEPVDKVLELKAGRTDTLGLREGDVLDFEAVASEELEKRLD